MPKSTAPDDLARLVQWVARHPEGVGVDALSALEDVPRRTLQRRLANLVQGRQLVLRGLGRAARYVVATSVSSLYAPSVAAMPLSAHEPGADYLPDGALPTSSDSEMIKAYVRQPRHLRQPVGFHSRFMEAYQPNVTAYLSPALRAQLRAMGRPTAGQAPTANPGDRLLIELPWGSSCLEGNTYTYAEAKRLLTDGRVAEAGSALEAQMILNHKEAMAYMLREPERISLTADTVIALHAFLSDGLMADPAAVGRLRRHAIEVPSSVYRPIALAQGVEGLFSEGLRKASEIEDPFEQSFFILVHLPYLLPFEDVNKPVSRLAANIPLMRHKLSPLTFVDVPQQIYLDAMLGVYELNRVELLRDVFLWAYARACQQSVATPSPVQPDAFRQRYRRQLGDMVAAIVRASERPTDAAVRMRLPHRMDGADVEEFVALVLTEFAALHAGNCVRFGLRPAEVESWLTKL